MDERWHFVESDNLWTWRLIGPTGVSVRSSEPGKDFGEIVSDALRCGFQPSSHHWHVITANGITRFEPGAAPQVHPERRSGATERDMDRRGRH
jgi:hypothetical protein